MTATLQPLTDRQWEVLDYIRAFQGGRGYMPTFRDLMSHFGMTSTNAITGHLKKLEKKGYITRDPDKARSIRLTGTEKRRCPHCGKEID